MPKRFFFGGGILAFALLAFGEAEGSVRQKAQQSVSASNLRQVTLAFLTRYTSPDVSYLPEKLPDMSAFIEEMARTDLFDAGLYLNYADLDLFESEPPKVVGFRQESEESASVELLPEILNYPIGFSVAVYPNLNSPASRTPLVWTRGLHRFQQFDAPYGGHVAYLDGHVEYFEGKPGQPNPELKEVFGEDSNFSTALRILEYTPPGWDGKEETPLPVRMEAYRKKSDLRSLWLNWTIFLGPATLAGLLAAWAAEPSWPRRILQFIIVGGIVLIVTLILVPSAIC